MNTTSAFKTNASFSPAADIKGTLGLWLEGIDELNYECRDFEDLNVGDVVFVSGCGLASEQKVIAATTRLRRRFICLESGWYFWGLANIQAAI